MGSVWGHWQLLLCAAALGFLIGAAVLAAAYLDPLARLRSAADDRDQARVLERELRRLRRLGDAAAVLEEHGGPEAEELRVEAELRALLLAWAAGRAGGGAKG